MSKWYGKVGFTKTNEYEPGNWEEEVIERNYYGDVITTRWKRQSSGNVNDEINLSNQISIVADQYIQQNCGNLAYVEYMGTNWSITDFDIQFPRIILSVGGIWNGNTP